MNPNQKILFVTTLSLATNPRLVKELDLAVSNGINARVVYFQMGNWSDKIDESIRESFPTVDFVILSARRHPWLIWMYDSIRERIFRLVPRLLLSDKLKSHAIGKRSAQLNRHLRNSSEKIDWVIAHNPAAFYPSMQHAAKHRCKLGLDMEDYHPGELSNRSFDEMVRDLIRAVFKKANYVSFAAPLIRTEVEKDLGYIVPNGITVLNSFKKEEFAEPIMSGDGRVRMVWFSQRITAGRGLEDVLDIVSNKDDQIELHLIGSMDPVFQEGYLVNLNNVYIHEPIRQVDLHNSLVNYDIGLAGDKAVDRNKELVISNKILAYLQSGLFVLAAYTPAKDSLLEQYQGMGVIYRNGEAGEAISWIIDNIEMIREERKTRYDRFREICWETESQKLLKIWKGSSDS